jgi:hypothetical protein
MLKLFFFALTFASYSIAATVNYDWDITWVNVAPDGFSRPVIGKGLFTVEYGRSIPAPPYPTPYPSISLHTQKLRNIV